MDIRLDGRTALITGGSKGLGFATAMRFAQSGADVAILARTRGPLDEARAKIAAAAPDRRIVAFACDVARPDAIKASVEATVAAFGKIDILVNNAGESRTGAFETVTDEMWQADIDQKLMAAVRLSRLVWPQMKERRWGRIINVLSITAKAPRAGGAPTGVTRAAGLALTKVLAGEGAPHNILVNALLVGLIVSDQIVRQHRAQGGAASFEDMVAAAGKDIPIGRMGEAGEFADVACFLASDAASYLSGIAIPVDGGKSPVI